MRNTAAGGEVSPPRSRGRVTITKIRRPTLPVRDSAGLTRPFAHWTAADRRPMTDDRKGGIDVCGEKLVLARVVSFL